ncbi:hypothetical protein H9643_15285 [Ochrobactrum sp. Sa2BUA5]|uniref:Uncharacterized protein n=1 Tax=Ochrobactrum quorumnocens TaxID=271865 RepID=A0A5N1JZQ4_9HYPH|nr:hypothetical protein [[Ochrobactrum] quorumnocens]KAA9367504.1 hypothetical protein F3W84_13970 [[Ochrobactrum] quorumnocens]MBD7992150.1 hypothetical protein [Ochrobactrum gallinarum]
MITGFMSAFAPPQQDRAPGGGGKRFKPYEPTGPRTPFPARPKRAWAGIRHYPHRLLCWMLAVLATKLASATYALSRFGVLDQAQTGWLLRLATRLHAKSVRMLMEGSW